MTRTFKVMDHMIGLRGSELRFRGRWLEAAGFPAGAVVRLQQVTDGVLVLTRIGAPMACAQTPPSPVPQADADGGAGALDGAPSVPPKRHWRLGYPL